MKHVYSSATFLSLAMHVRLKYDRYASTVVKVHCAINDMCINEVSFSTTIFLNYITSSWVHHPTLPSIAILVSPAWARDA